MKFVRKHLVVAGLLASIGAVAIAQAPAPQAGAAGGPPPTARMERHDPAKMKEHMAKRQAELKAQLKITAAQEGAWTAFTTAMTPTTMGQRPDRAEFDKLTTPQRLDKMRELRTQRNAAMDKRADATKAFYATLTPEQQKTFDTSTQRMVRGGRGGDGGHGGHHGHRG